MTSPFENEDETPSTHSQKIGLKNVSSAKSMFDSLPKKPSQEEFEKKVDDIQNKYSDYKKRASELTSEFFKIISDKTLKQNKNIFSKEYEKEILTKMVQLAIEINNDQIEKEGMGSLALITQLMKICLLQRDKINDLEFSLEKIEKKLNTNYLAEFISKEIKTTLDKLKGNE